MAENQSKLRRPHFQREGNPNWMGGETVTAHGYVLIRVGTEHHLADVRGYAYKHRVVAEQALGRRLQKGEIVHHIDGNKKNNSPDNLKVCAGTAEHLAEHRTRSDLRSPGQPNPVIQCECGCGEEFRKFDSSNRPRTFVSGHNEQPSPAMDAVLIAMKTGEWRVQEIVKATGRTKSAVHRCLSKLIAAGTVLRVSRGTYVLTDTAEVEDV